MAEANWVLNPSDFAFLWEECKRCFYLKVKEKFRRPDGPMPAVFTRIDRAMKDCFDGQRTEKLLPALPPGKFDCSVNWVQSAPLAVPGHTDTCMIRGKPDTIIHFDDGTYAIIDFKTSNAKDAHVALYGRQLHAYAWAFERNAATHPHFAPMKRLGLVVFDPQKFELASATQASLGGALVWREIARDDAGFEKFLGEVLDVLDRPKPPDADSCGWCAYREASRRNGF